MSEGNQVFPDQLIFFVQINEKRDFENFRVFFPYFAAPENIDATTRMVFGNFEGDRVSTAIFLKRKYEAKMEIPGVRMGWEVLSLNGP